MANQAGECALHADIVRRIEDLEDRVDKIDEDITKKSIVDAEIKKDIKSLQDGFTSLKTEVLSTVKDHTDRTWGLINKGIKIITILTIIIAILAGVKLAPDIIKLFLGGI